jgi:photosystem II stability/assembly factor-like uncharacterized protein
VCDTDGAIRSVSLFVLALGGVSSITIISRGENHEEKSAAGHSDALTAYAAVNTLRVDDMRPHIFRTHDGGKRWTEIVSGIPEGAPVDVVREDPKTKGLLFSGSEREVYVSFDDGGQWQSLRLNMPASSIRDLIVKDDDVVAATHGRSFWILDNITPLRQLNAAVSGTAG